MDKLDMQTKNLANEKYQALKDLFPNAITETINKNGEVVRAIDKDILMQEISTQVVEGKEERYQFTWPDKKKAILNANAPLNKTLRPSREESVNFDETENLYIEGDNLEVLKLLQETYLGKVDVIYIDPPYNTGKDFVYNDNFKESIDEYLENSGQYDDDGNRLEVNKETNGRYHTDWLNMMYPRLKLARDLISDDGVVFISIDDNEQENLKKICDEIFGRRNFIGEIVWKSATDNNPRQISIEHEYVICYAKNILNQTTWIIESEKAHLIINKYKELTKKTSDLSEIQTALRKWIKNNEIELKGVAHYNNVDEKGVYSNSSNSSNTKPGGYDFDIIHPITGKVCVKPDFGWRWPKKTFEKYDKEGNIHWGYDESTQPRVKKRIDTVTELLKSVYYEDNRASTKRLENLLGSKKIFENPKPVKLIKRLINFTTSKDSLILDFFSGSATTAHAIMQLNAEDGGNRKYIMVQLPEETDEKTEAYKAGYKTIAEIGKERIRRAGKQIFEENKDKEGIQNLDVGFRVLKTDSSNMKDVYYSPVDTEQNFLDDLEDNIKEDRTSEDLLFQVMLDLGVSLSSKIESETIDGKEVFVVEDRFLIACFDKDVSEDTVKEIAKKEPYYAVFRDRSMASDSVAANFDQIFASISPETIRRVI